MNLPNSLTLLRIFIVPLLVVVLLTPFSENWFGVPRHIFGVALFLGAALTDYLDGHRLCCRAPLTVMRPIIMGRKLNRPLQMRMLDSSGPIILAQRHALGNRAQSYFRDLFLAFPPILEIIDPERDATVKSSARFD